MLDYDMREYIHNCMMIDCQPKNMMDYIYDCKDDDYNEETFYKEPPKFCQENWKERDSSMSCRLAKVDQIGQWLMVAIDGVLNCDVNFNADQIYTTQKLDYLVAPKQCYDAMRPVLIVFSTTPEFQCVSYGEQLLLRYEYRACDISSKTEQFSC